MRITPSRVGAAMAAAVTLSIGGVTPGASAAPSSQSATSSTYVVLYKQATTPSDAASRIAAAGGTVVANHSQIGVVVARSSNDAFAENVRRDGRVDGVSATGGFGVKPFQYDESGGGGNLGDLPNAPASDTDPLSPLQWDMRQIHAPEAHAVTGGSPAVIVGDIDTGIDKDHPDLAQNIDFSRSVSCESGAPDPNPAAWDDRNGHGTHTAGTIAAASNGIGIVGVAPNVKLAAIKASTDEGYFFPEMVICAFMWAATNQIDVTNNSYFADPFLYNCRNEPVQRAIWKAEQRAIRFALNNGVTVVAAEGNQSDDLSHPTVDTISPDYPPGSEQEREVTNACVVVPVEIPGVIGVTAVGNTRQTDGDNDPDDYLKSFYSSYGVSSADLTAPGGDSVFGVTTEAPNGRVLSTWPAESPCSRAVSEPASGPTPAMYCYLQGTSMASPHVAGVAALIISRFGDLSSPQNGKMRPNQVEAYLQQTANPQPCPTALPAGYEAFTNAAGVPQQCQGGPGHASWYGAGQVDAFAAVTKTSGSH